ncbi:serine/threonine protein kinase [bacterium]|nr:serine/threonine protein kinase [bacterium]
MAVATVPFGELAVLEDLVTPEQLTLTLSRQAAKRGAKVGTLLVRQGHLTRDEAREVLRLQREQGPIEGYALLDKLGSGGMGSVYRAIQRSLEREVAIKILSPRASRDARFRARFLQETRLLARLEHPNLVRAYEAGECRGHLFLAMECVRGKTAKALLDEHGPLPESEALAYMEQIAGAISHYAERRIVHRDLKPENILVTLPDDAPPGRFPAGGRAKLADLGLSKHLDSDLGITIAGKTLGTPLYISPELALAEGDVDIRSDLYSLGATFYHLATGSPPFPCESAGDLLTAHVIETPRDPRSVNPALSPGFSALLARLLDKSRRKRFQSPGELLAAIAKLRDPCRAKRRAVSEEEARPGSGSRHRAKRRASSPVGSRMGLALVLAAILAATVASALLALS